MEIKDIKRFIYRLRVGDVYYKVSNTPSGAKVEKLTVKQILYGARAIIFSNQQAREVKIYFGELETLLTESQAKEKLREVKQQGAIKNTPPVYTFDTQCFNCGTNISYKGNNKKCPICGWVKCPTCGACKCYHPTK